MSDSTLYDDDILLWSEQQAEVIRRLRETTHNLPNDLDVENVAEEIESVGRSELAAVESHIFLLIVHLMKLFIEPDAETADHWREEMVTFSFGLRRRYATSMRQRIDLNEIWREARHRVNVAYGRRGATLIGPLPSPCPISLDELLAEPIEIDGLIERLRRPEPDQVK